MMQRIFWVGLFAVAMAAVESAVVAYLRAGFYPEGMQVPLDVIPVRVLGIEVGREVATIVMLVAVAMLAGMSRRERFAFFMYAFGIWDIFYYLWLEAFIDWPASLFEWDILFLIPVPWTGPVLAPVLISAALITAAMLALLREAQGRPLALSRRFWLLEILIGLILILSFVIDYQAVLDQSFPERYRWEIFLPAYFIGIGIFVWSLLRSLESKT